MNNRKILIVDDDYDIRLGMIIRLTANQYDPFFAGDAVSALIEAEKHQPSLVILDLGLPGHDGFVVMERFKQLPMMANIPIIVVSARRAAKERAIEAGAKAFLAKPFDDVDLLALIRTITGDPALSAKPSRYN